MEKRRRNNAVRGQSLRYENSSNFKFYVFWRPRPRFRDAIGAGMSTRLLKVVNTSNGKI